MDSIQYKGYWIDFNVYGKGEYTLQNGDADLWFETLEEAKDYIDSLEEE